MALEMDYGNVPSEIHRHLRERILRGRLRGGDSIKIGAVAKEFGVSIIPVREAMRMLEADRLIDMRPRRSPAVSGLSRNEVLEIAEIRLALEPVALAAAIPRLTDEAVRSCEAALDEYQTSQDPWRQVELNRQFHLTLYQPCGMTRLMQIIAEQYDGMTRCAQAIVIRSSKDVDKSGAEHSAILDACKEGAIEAAVARLRAHLDASIERLREELDSVKLRV